MHEWMAAFYSSWITALDLSSMKCLPVTLFYLSGHVEGGGFSAAYALQADLSVHRDRL